MLLVKDWFQAIYTKLNYGNYLRYSFLRPQDMSLTENCIQVFLSMDCEHGSVLYAIYKGSIYNFV